MMVFRLTKLLLHVSDDEDEDTDSESVSRLDERDATSDEES